MSLTSSLDTKERVRQANDIVDLVGQHISLRREGRLYKGLCPWHDDSRPSLQVNPERQTYKCWVCDIGGDVFSFVMQREGVSFPEALAMLADRAGIELALGHGDASTQPASAHIKQHLYRAAAWAEQQYHQCLLSSTEAESARRYLAERGIRDEFLHTFHIGYAPDRWDWLINRAGGSEFSPSDLEKIGLVATSTKTGRRYDRFRGRVLFSIRDVQGRPIAVGGRILPSTSSQDIAKYINSPETPLFSKSSQLYGLNVAREPIARSRQAIVMEGYTDCIVAQQFGFETALAVLGTALGERHVRLLSRYADRITLVLDGDEAGQRRAGEILGLFIAGQLELRVLTLPEGLDPCDFLLARGADAFRAQLEAAPDALEHKVRVATRGIDPGGASHEANRALEDVLATMARAPRLRSGAAMETKLREDQFLTRLARQFQAPEEILRGRLLALRRPSSSGPGRTPLNETSPASPRMTTTDPWERELIEILLQEPEAASKAAESLVPEQLRDPACRQIFAKCCELSVAGINPVFDRLLLEFEDPAVKGLLVDMDERGRDRGGSDLAAQLPELLASLRRRAEQHEQLARTTELREKRFDESEEVAILTELLEKSRDRQRER